MYLPRVYQRDLIYPHGDHGLGLGIRSYGGLRCAAGGSKPLPMSPAKKRNPARQRAWVVFFCREIGPHFKTPVALSIYLPKKRAPCLSAYLSISPKNRRPCQWRTYLCQKKVSAFKPLSPISGKKTQSCEKTGCGKGPVPPIETGRLRCWAWVVNTPRPLHRRCRAAEVGWTGTSARSSLLEAVCPLLCSAQLPSAPHPRARATKGAGVGERLLCRVCSST